MYVMPLTEEQIKNLPFPETARLLGGLLMPDTHPLENHLNIEKFRQLWNEQIKNAKEFNQPIFEIVQDMVKK